MRLIRQKQITLGLLLQLAVLVVIAPFNPAQAAFFDDKKIVVKDLAYGEGALPGPSTSRNRCPCSSLPCWKAERQLTVPIRSCSATMPARPA